MAKNNIELQKDTTGGLTIQFNNCSVDFPTTNGLHVVSSGCGSGKTTIIGEIIKEKWASGILVVVATIEAAEELATRITSRTTGLLGYKVCVLHSDKSRLTEMEEYKKDPRTLESYDVLIITSARLIIDPYELFLSYKGEKRGYVFIDEMINFYPPSFEIPKEFIHIVTHVDQCKTHDGKKGMEFGSNGQTWYQHIYQDKSTMKAAYHKSGYRLFKAKNGLTEYKAEYVMDHILKKGLAPISGRVKDFANEACIILFDGTADSIFKASDTRLLPVCGYRYSSDIRFVVFKQHLKRKNNEDWSKNDIKTYGKDFLDMTKNACVGGKNLIVTWKTVDVFKSRKNDGTPDRYEGQDKTQYNFPVLLSECLKENGTSPDDFTVIYRGSGRDRGSNEFRDYQSITFLGEWRIPDNIVGDINRMFGCKCSFKDYMKSLMIQTICRTQIREHTGLPITVYLSDDIDYNLMYEVQEYFRENSSLGCKVEGIKKPCPKLSKPEKKQTVDMITLYSYDPEIRESIRKEKDYSFTITLGELFTLIPKPKKTKDRYKNLVKFMITRGITMNIV